MDYKLEGIKMKVLVLNPPVFGSSKKFTREGRCQSEADTWLTSFPPATLASIAGAVREKYETKLIDCIGANISFEDCIKEVKEFNPDYTIIDTSTPTISLDLETAKQIKESTKSKIIMYGEHVTARSNELLKHKQVDYCILGEPETPILSIIEGKPKVDGVAMRGFKGEIWQEPDLDKLPFPAYDLLPDYKYPLTLEKWTFLRSGRGCPFNCNFCIIPLMSNRNARYHSTEYMIKQIAWIVNNLGIKVWMFWDELATLKKQRMIDLCERIKKAGLNKATKWFCTTRVDVLDEELVKAMKEAGCKMIAFGLESGNQEVLDKNNTNKKIDKAIRSVAIARKYGLRTIGHFIIGLPGSSEETEKQTIELAKRLKLDFAQFYTATPFPGSKLYSIVKENNWFLHNDWKHVEQSSITISYKDFPAEKIHYWRRKAYRKFYIRPIAIWRGLTAMSPRALLRLPRYAITFTRWMRQ